MKKLRIAILAGGFSNERGISIKTGERIAFSLNKKKYEILRYDPKVDLQRFINDGFNKKYDLIFPALHGANGEDGKLQGLFDLLRIPYVFSGTSASATAMNKKISKLIAKDVGLDIAPGLNFRKKDKINFNEIVKLLKFPIVIKPNQSGSSIGISIAKTIAGLKRGIKLAFKYDDEIILEKYISGREFTVGVLGENGLIAMPVVEILPKQSKWFDFNAKYSADGSDEICPAKISKVLEKKLHNQAKQIYSAIGCKSLARIDFIYCPQEDKIYFIEINTIPGLTPTSLIPKSVQAMGMEFERFLDIIITSSSK